MQLKIDKQIWVRITLSIFMFSCVMVNAVYAQDYGKKYGLTDQESQLFEKVKARTSCVKFDFRAD